MKPVSIYQTLEDRDNYDEVEHHGPYYCYRKDSDGRLKTGIKTPWLGEGYYFWDSLISDAHWWGQSIYQKNGKSYIICETFYDQHSPLLFDTVSDILLLKQIKDCAQILKRQRGLSHVSFPLILGYLRKMPDFGYKAIRVYPMLKEYHPKIIAEFPSNKYVLNMMEKVQICFFDKTLLTAPFRIVYPERIPDNFTI